MSSFSYRDISIHYNVQGEGKPVLLLHGFGEDSTVWDNQVSFLKDHSQIITLDLPGSGKSPLLSNTKTIDDYAETVKAFLDALQAAPVILLGHSMGGYIALAFAEKYPQYLRAFGLVHSTAFADSHEKKETRKKGIDFIRKNGGFSFLKTSIPNLFSERTKKQNPQIINELTEKSKQFSDEALIQYYEAMMVRPDRTAVLSSSECPILFILGTEDTAAPLNDVLKQVHLPRTSYIHVIENAGHMSMTEAPETLNQHLLRFINEV